MSIDVRFRVNRGEFSLNVDLTLPSSGVTALFGPSGCGKTTLLRAMAGLDHPSGGHMSFSETPWQDGKRFVPTHLRCVGFVFQEQSLFPHLTVQQNLQYGRTRVRGREQTIALEQAIELLGIQTLLTRRPETLSGGERQRVAIARALAISPRLLLMDEPLASLDISRRREILPYIESLQRELGIPIVYVSHLIEEVARLADHVVILDAGRVTMTGDVHDIFANLDLPLARHADAGVVVETVVAEHDEAYQLTRLDFEGGHILVPRSAGVVGGRQRIRIAARDVSVTLTRAGDSSILNRVAATVDQLSEDHAAQVTVRLLAGTTPILARITRKSVHDLGLQPGSDVFAQIKSVALLA